MLSLADPESSPAAHVAGRILFSQFNIQRVLNYGTSLLGSEGAQYDMDLSVAGKQPSLLASAQYDMDLSVAGKRPSLLASDDCTEALSSMAVRTVDLCVFVLRLTCVCVEVELCVC